MTEAAWQWAESLGHWLLTWTVVVVVIYTWQLVTKVRRAGVRYAGWLVATFAGAAFLPVVLSISPVVSVPQAIGYIGGDAASAAERLDDWSEWFRRDRGAARIAAPTAGLSGGADQPVKTNRVSIVELLLAAWTAGFAIYLVRLVFAAVRVRRLIAGSNVPVPAELLAQFDATRRELGIGRDIRLVVHPDTQTPLCTGLVRPTVVWPAAANDALCPRERRAAMIHELTHLRRYDDWLRLAGELWRSLCWFYLPVHWTLSRLRREQEYLCDDLAALTLDCPETYAQLLLDHTRVRVPSPILCSSFGGGSAMTSRVRRILRGERRVTPLSRKQTTILVALSAVLLVGAGSLRLVGSVTSASLQGPESERRAVAALKDLDAKLAFNDDGRVESVDFSEAKITDAGLAHLKGLADLERLNLRATQISDTSLANLQGMTKLESLNLAGTKITDASLKDLTNSASLTALDLQETRITDAGLKHLTRLTSLTRVLLGGTDITDAGLVHLKGLTNMQVLRLGETKIDGTGFVRLAGLKKLRRLSLYATPVTDDALENLIGLTSLDWLNLNHTDITDNGLVHLRALANLEWLMLERTKVTNVGLVHLDVFKKLIHLGLDETAVTDAGLVHLKGLTQLASLAIDHTAVSNIGLQHLKGMTGLRHVRLNATSITNAGMIHLKSISQTIAATRDDPRDPRAPLVIYDMTDEKLEQLEGLADLEAMWLYESKLTDAGLRHLRGMRGLERLDLIGPGITDDGLIHLTNLPSLRWLVLRDNDITGNGLKRLARVPQLSKLTLSNARITDAELAHLEGLSNLGSLTLEETKVTNDGIQKLKRDLPKCTVVSQ